VGLSDTILKGTYPRTIPARFGLIWFYGLKGKDLNVKIYNVRHQLISKTHMGFVPISKKKKNIKKFTFQIYEF
jgi:hypothetical protein